MIIVFLMYTPALKTNVRCASSITETGYYRTMDSYSVDLNNSTCVATGANPSSGSSVAPSTGGVVDVSNPSPTGIGIIPVDSSPSNPTTSNAQIYYDSGSVDIKCTDSTAFYNFTIPSDAISGSSGTQNITITNQKGWDTWIEITSVSPNNGLTITGVNPDNLYQYIPNNNSATFALSWTWDGTNTSGNLGNATVYFKSVCTKPASRIVAMSFCEPRS